MPNGDLASARGWTTFASTQNRSQGYDNDNYGLDRAAEQAARLDVVEGAVNQPVFAAKQGTAASNVPHATWAALSSWATPRLLVGFTKFQSGQLTITKAGVYRVQAHIQFPSEYTLSFVGIQVVKNTLTADTAEGTIAKNVPGPANSADTGDLVSLAAGDVVALLVRQENASRIALVAGRSEYDITWSLEWVRP